MATLAGCSLPNRHPSLMSLDPLAQLQELARTDAALRQALDAAATPADLLGLARLHKLELSESAAQGWLETRTSAAPSAEMLAAISLGLCGDDGDAIAEEISDEDLAAIAGGQSTAGEALMTRPVGEAAL